MPDRDLAARQAAERTGVTVGPRARQFAQPSGSDLYINQPLTNIAIAYMQSTDEFVADKIFPNVPVVQQSGTYWSYTRDNWNRPEGKVRAPGTESVGAGWNTATATYSADVYSLHKDVAWQDRANAVAPFDLDRDATDFVTRNLLLTRELIFAQKFFTTSIWGLDMTGVASGPTGNQFLQWNDAASTPIKDIRTQATLRAQATGFRPNVLILGPLVYDQLIDHPTVLDRIKYTTADVPDEALLARLFRIDRVLIASAIQNTANEGATEAESFIFGKAALLAYVPPRAGLLNPSAGYTFSWNNYLPGQGLGVAMDRFDLRHLKSTRVEGEMAFDMKVVSADLGVFFASAVA